jgi:HicB family
MNLLPYIENLHRHLMAAADAGGEEARAVAERLIAPLEAATRLVLLEALSAAAGEITRDLAPGSVDVRLRGTDPEFVVATATDHPFETVAAPPAPAAEGVEDTDEGPVSRITLRLPDHLKARVERQASREGLSINTWLVRAVSAALESDTTRRSPRQEPGAQSFTGWARS